MGRKRKTPATEAPSRDRLAALGIEASDPSGALLRLREQWGQAPEVEAWVVHELAASADAATAVLLGELEPRTNDKRVRRSLKQTLYRLAQKGIWQPPEASAPPSARELLGGDDEGTEAWLSPIDPSGTRLAWMARSARGGMLTISAVLSEDHGVREFHAGKTTRKALREMVADIGRRTRTGLTPTPWRWVDHLIRQAWERSEQSRFPDLPGAVAAVTPRVETSTPIPPVDERIDRAAAEADEAALAASAALLEKDEIGGWLLPIEGLEGTLETVLGAEESVVLLSPASREEQQREALEDATRNLLDPGDRRERFAVRLEETAHLFAVRGDDEAAVQAVAAAAAARAGKAIEDIPLLSEITRRSILLALQARSTQEAEQRRSSLVVTPQQALQEQRRRGR